MIPEPLNSINLLSSFVTLFAGAASTWAWSRKRVKVVQGRLQLLEAQKITAENMNDDLNAELVEARQQRDVYAARLPDVAFYAARADWTTGDHDTANDIVKSWIDREGDTISQLLLYRANWSQEHAAGALRPMGLLAAETYATAAAALWPQNQEAVDLLMRVADFRTEVFDQSSTIAAALEEFDERADTVFEISDVGAAEDAEKEAEYRYNHGQYHLALPVAELALDRLVKTEGPTAVKTLAVKRLKAYIVMMLGHPEDALAIAQSVVEDSIINPALGPDHPNTLVNEYLYAILLHQMGRNEEALEKTKLLEASFAFGNLFWPTSAV